MPQMGGLEMGQRLRSLRPELPVLFTSGYVEQVVIEQALKIPGATFLAKPYLPADLLKRVRELLDQTRS
jgi:CheY-like chemotaxis protein